MRYRPGFTRILLVVVVLGACSETDKSPEKSGDSTSSAAVPPTATAAPSTTVAPSAARFCELAGDPVEVGRLEDPALVEVSGVVASRRHPSVLWVHNDSGDSARLFAIDRTGARRAEIVLDGITATDWEDITIAPGPGGDEIVVADIGDNRAQRSEVSVVRVPEPDLPADPSEPIVVAGLEPERLTYPDGAHDAEAIFVDPGTGELVVVTKAWVGVSHAFTTVDGVGDPLRDLGEIALGGGQLVTAADADAGGVLLRTYGDVWVFGRDQDEPIATTLGREPCRAPVAREQQGEAIALLPGGGGYVTVSEGAGSTLWEVHS